MSINLRPARANTNRIPPLQDQQSAVQTLLGIPTATNKLASERSKTGTPTNRQPSLQFVFNTANFLHQLFTALSLTLGDRIHGRRQEKTDGLVDVRFCSDGRESEFCEGLGDAYDGFELADGDGDG